MEKIIIDIIDDKAMSRYKTMTDANRKAYRAMLYAGTQVSLNGFSLHEVAQDIGYSDSGTYKLVQKWIRLMKDGDITVNVIIQAINKLPKKKRFHRSERVTPPAEEPSIPEQTKQEITNEIPDIPSKSIKKGKKVLGFIITPEDERRERAAIRDSILFFQNYGQGRQPRMNGEYFAPGTNPDISDEDKDEGKWLSLETAALYCGCREELIKIAGHNGDIKRRVYKRSSNRKYYEYNLEDLNRFIHENNLF